MVLIKTTSAGVHTMTTDSQPPTNTPRADVMVSAGIVIVAFILTVLILIFFDPHSTWRYWAERFILGALALGVPIWFLYEYASRTNNGMRPDQLDQLKYGQELARNFWLAMIAVLAFMFDLIEWPAG
jgi:hypothetical protein